MYLKSPGGIVRGKGGSWRGGHGGSTGELGGIRELQKYSPANSDKLVPRRIGSPPHGDGDPVILGACKNTNPEDGICIFFDSNTEK